VDGTKQSEIQKRNVASADTINTPIQLDSVCSTQGMITPRWFRFEDEEHSIHTVKIEKIFSHKEINFVGIRMLQFICGARIGEQEKIFELRYHVATHKWTLFQILT